MTAGGAAAAWLGRAGHWPAGRAILVPGFPEEAARWARGEGPWSGGPSWWGAGRPLPAPGAPALAVWEGAGGRLEALQVRALDPADWRGTGARIAPGMAEARAYSMRGPGPPERGERVAVLLRSGLGPLRADGRALLGPMSDCIAMLLCLAADGARLWELAAWGSAPPILVASAWGLPLDQGPPVIGADTPGGLGEIVGLAFDPGQSAGTG